MCSAFCVPPEKPTSVIEDSKTKAMFDWMDRERVSCPYRLADFASTGRGVVTVRGACLLVTLCLGCEY